MAAWSGGGGASGGQAWTTIQPAQLRMRAACALRGGLSCLQAAAAASVGRQSELAWHGLGCVPLPSGGHAAIKQWQQALTAAVAMIPGGFHSSASSHGAAMHALASAAEPGQQQQQQQQTTQQQQQAQQQSQQQGSASGKKRRRRQQQRGGSEGGSTSTKHEQASLHIAEQVCGNEPLEVLPRGGAEAEAGDALPEAAVAACPLPPARVLQDDAHPIRESDISRPAWFVLSRLRAAGTPPCSALPPARACRPWPACPLLLDQPLSRPADVAACAVKAPSPPAWALCRARGIHGGGHDPRSAAGGHPQGL